jgi:spermidine synthase
MNPRFEELDWQRTPLGEFTLRRRRDLTVDQDVYEVKLGEEFLMSSLFTVAEIELARLALAVLDRSDLAVMVGGLGLGYTARAALADERVAGVTVIEAAEPVLDWHRRGLIPDTAGLATDPRCRLVHGDFFRLVAGEPETTYDAILLDIDHTPSHLLATDHADFYGTDGLTAMTRHLRPDGVFALWSDDPPNPAFQDVLREVFADASAELVRFDNPITGGESSNTVYLGRRTNSDLPSR